MVESASLISSSDGDCLDAWRSLGPNKGSACFERGEPQGPGPQQPSVLWDGHALGVWGWFAGVYEKRKSLSHEI